MTNRIFLMTIFAFGIAVVWWTAMHATPGKGFHRLMEKTFQGILMCYVCYLVLSPFGYRLPQTPAAALLGGYLGVPGIALCAFLTMWP